MRLLILTGVMWVFFNHPLPRPHTYGVNAQGKAAGIINGYQVFSLLQAAGEEGVEIIGGGSSLGPVLSSDTRVQSPAKLILSKELNPPNSIKDDSFTPGL